MTVSVVDDGNGVRLDGDWEGVADANRFLGHLRARAFSPATVRAYAFDLVNLARFTEQRRLPVAEVTAMDVFDWIDWQRTRRSPARARSWRCARGVLRSQR